VNQARLDIQLTDDVARHLLACEILKRRLGGENWQIVPTLEEYDSVDE
jgi:hypothetical protein